MIKKYFYNSLSFKAKTRLSSVMLSIFMMPSASAHLMVAQHGTLNFKDDGVFMVLSLPVSAFKEADDNNDGKMSFTEFTKHRTTIITSVNKRVKLIDEKGLRPLQGLLLSPVASHMPSKALADQLIVMGRFALADIKSAKSNKFTFHISLFGNSPSEQSLEITATRKHSIDSTPEKHKIILTPKQTDHLLFNGISKLNVPENQSTKPQL